MRSELDRLLREYDTHIWRKSPGAESDAPAALCAAAERCLAGVRAPGEHAEQERAFWENAERSFGAA